MIIFNYTVDGFAAAGATIRTSKGFICAILATSEDILALRPLVQGLLEESRLSTAPCFSRKFSKITGRKADRSCTPVGPRQLATIGLG